MHERDRGFELTFLRSAERARCELHGAAGANREFACDRMPVTGRASCEKFVQGVRASRLAARVAFVGVERGLVDLPPALDAGDVGPGQGVVG